MGLMLYHNRLQWYDMILPHTLYHSPKLYIQTTVELFQCP